MSKAGQTNLNRLRSIERLNELKDFVELNNKLPRMTTDDKIESSLGFWCNNQRNNRDNLSDEIKTGLEAIPGWTWESINPTFEDRILELKVYIARHKSMPNKGKNSDKKTKSLADWCTKQQKLNKIDVKKLTQSEIYRINTLNEIPEWAWGNKKHSAKEILDALQEYHDDKNNEPDFRKTYKDIPIGRRWSEIKNNRANDSIKSLLPNYKLWK